MTDYYKISVQTKNVIQRKPFKGNQLFNAIQDDNGDWFLSRLQIVECDNPPYVQLLKDIDLDSPDEFILTLPDTPF